MVGIQDQGQTEADRMNVHFTELRTAGEKTSGGGWVTMLDFRTEVWARDVYLSVTSI